MFEALVRRITGKYSNPDDLQRRLRMREHFPHEMGLLEGTGQSASAKPSVILFTCHKCASVYTRDVFRDLALDSGMIPVNFEKIIFEGEVTAAERETIYGSGGKRLYPPQGYSFAPFRAYHAGFHDLDPYRIVLMLRDPRDVLVSYYYSMAYSHSVPSGETASRETIVSEREKASSVDIDSYVLEKSGLFLETYQNYLTFVHGRANTLLVTYEQMIADYPAWLSAIVKHTQFSPTHETKERLVREWSDEVESEDPLKHRRQVTPGDHRRKLKPETIAELNERFGPLLTVFGYI